MSNHVQEPFPRYRAADLALALAVCSRSGKATLPYRLIEPGIKASVASSDGGIVPHESDGTFRQTSIEATKATTGVDTLTRADLVDASQRCNAR
jgi:hypothetical protein